jgi:hypothetical protein
MLTPCNGLRRLSEIFPLMGVFCAMASSETNMSNGSMSVRMELLLRHKRKVVYKINQMNFYHFFDCRCLLQHKET